MADRIMFKPEKSRVKETKLWLATLVLAYMGMALTAPAYAQADGGSNDSNSASPSVVVLSSAADRISGGSALISVNLQGPAKQSTTRLRATLNGHDVSSEFNPDPADPKRWLAVIANMQDGTNTLAVHVAGKTARLRLVNYPKTGPIFSGPLLSPFICQTASFVLPDGTRLGEPTDANCSAPTRVNYVYRSTAGGPLKPMSSVNVLPKDVAMTTTLSGVTVPFVVRVETGTMDRGIYQNAVLHDPTKDPAPSPFTPPAGWNRRLLAVHGTGCTGGWYVQGGALGASLLTGDNLMRLAEGWGIFSNTLNHPSNSCNAVLAGESTMMGKEHFIKSFGVPAFTVSAGSSGGAYTSLQLADMYPGLFDGVFINATFPDALSIAMAGTDARLLSNYFLTQNTAKFTEAQMVAVSGHKSPRAWYDVALQAGRTDPVPGRIDPIPANTLPVVGSGYQSAVWSAAVPVSLRYDPRKNPSGARPTVFDVARNIFGVDKATGFALRPFDNVGVQYGLEAFNAGVITTAQFLDLNEKIGGVDQDANYVPERTTGDPGAIRRAYQSGLNLNGNAGLTSIPILDTTGIYDEDTFYHYQWFHFAVRERLRAANDGDVRNHVMWRGGGAFLGLFTGTSTPEDRAVARASATLGWSTFVDWVAAYKADSSAATQRDKVISHRPAAAVDGCFTKSTLPQFIAEPQTFSSQPDSQCNTLWPSYSAPRIEAGGPVAANKLKCELKPVVASDYKVTLTETEIARLRATFPTGVCDWSKQGKGQTRTVPFASFGPSPVNLVFDITK